MPLGPGHQSPITTPWADDDRGPVRFTGAMNRNPGFTLFRRTVVPRQCIPIPNSDSLAFVGIVLADDDPGTEGHQADNHRSPNGMD